MAVFPSELKYILNHFFHQLERLLYLGLYQGSEVHHAHVHLWFGDKSSSWNCKDVSNIAEVLSHNREATTLFASCIGCKSLCHFLLKSQSHLSSAINKRSISTGNIFKPLDNQWSWNTKGRFPIICTFGGSSSQGLFRLSEKAFSTLNVKTSPWTILSFPGAASESICNPGINRVSFSTTRSSVMSALRIDLVIPLAQGPLRKHTHLPDCQLSWQFYLSASSPGGNSVIAASLLAVWTT